MKLYKLTDREGNTQGNTHWDVGVTHRNTKCDNPHLCSQDVFHAYTNLNLAFLLNPNNANIENPLVWECKGAVVVKDYGKVGCFALTITRKLRTPKWVKSDKAQRVQVAFAILCAESVLHIYEEKYPDDARPRKAIEAAKEYLKNPTADAYASDAAADAAYAATHAADAAAYASYAADAAYAAAAAAYAATDAAASYAATHADAATDIDFGALADKAVEMGMSNL
jgi:hypothetical protein